MKFLRNTLQITVEDVDIIRGATRKGYRAKNPLSFEETKQVLGEFCDRWQIGFEVDDETVEYSAPDAPNSKHINVLIGLLDSMPHDTLMWLDGYLWARDVDPWEGLDVEAGLVRVRDQEIFRLGVEITLTMFDDGMPREHIELQDEIAIQAREMIAATRIENFGGIARDGGYLVDLPRDVKDAVHSAIRRFGKMPTEGLPDFS
ncbi:hypothetical protein J7382_08505 [Shimia sp. R11_0]|uniref:hypothetical protein n=1 Tax=Shimia sp. R11_0 TaxID=2821096 RepID=UPI001ADBAE4B|nr:hypothetical protein [Shimia sp. R11_0]MBO9477570.1 hypothetical protein [Shimia sp. R11_0]